MGRGGGGGWGAVDERGRCEQCRCFGRWVGNAYARVQRSDQQRQVVDGGYFVAVGWRRGGWSRYIFADQSWNPRHAFSPR